MVTATLFTIAKTWKQPKRPLTEELVKKKNVVHINNGILLSFKKNEIMSLGATCMGQDIIILNKVK